MYTKAIELPILMDNSGNVQLGGPSTIGSSIAASVANRLTVDAETLASCVLAASSMLEYVRSSCLERLDVATLSFQLGVTAGGKVGFLGAGATVGVAAQFQITFKPK